jgi:hypothetical protein
MKNWGYCMHITDGHGAITGDMQCCKTCLKPKSLVKLFALNWGIIFSPSPYNTPHPRHYWRYLIQQTHHKTNEQNNWQAKACLLQMLPAGSTPHCFLPRTTKTWSCWERSWASIGFPLKMSLMLERSRLLERQTHHSSVYRWKTNTVFLYIC